MHKTLIILPLLGLAACATPRESCIAAGFLRAAALDVADGGSGKTDRDADRGVGHSCGAQGLDSG